MKTRLLSILLSLCMALTMFPAGAFAAQPEQEQLYAQMLELGLVDGDGALIEDNSFTVEDGTRLSSLSALTDWLNQCTADELDTVITVDATGRTATAEQLMYALSIEYQMTGLAQTLSRLASSDSVALTSAGDADAAAHALCDAMLLATGLGELGTVFGVDRPEWAGASGRSMVLEVRRMAAEAGWVLGNATVQVVGNRPRMAARLPEACAVMSEIAGGTVTVSATTSDHLGFTGRGEGVAALASVLMVRAES